VLLEMAWGCEKEAHADDRMEPTFLHAIDLRTTLELLTAEIKQAEDLLGGLEGHLCKDEEESTASS
jgi:hypothetical protein